MVDLIIMRQVLEHVKDPKMFLKHSFNMLNDNGIGYIEVPNISYKKTRI